MNTGAAVPLLFTTWNALGPPSRNQGPGPVKGNLTPGRRCPYGFAAVGSPGAGNFKPPGSRASGDFRTRADGQGFIWSWTLTRRGPTGSRTIADLFLKAGLPVPLRIVSVRKDLTDFMKG